MAHKQRGLGGSLRSSEPGLKIAVPADSSAEPNTTSDNGAQLVSRQRVAEAIHRLGPRALHELLLEIGQRTGDDDLVTRIAATYAEIDCDFLHAIGGGHFPPQIWRAS